MHFTKKTISTATKKYSSNCRLTGHPSSFPIVLLDILRPIASDNNELDSVTVAVERLRISLICYSRLGSNNQDPLDWVILG